MSIAQYIEAKSRISLQKTKTFAQRHFKKNYKHTRYVLCFFVILANK